MSALVGNSAIGQAWMRGRFTQKVMAHHSDCPSTDD